MMRHKLTINTLMDMIEPMIDEPIVGVVRDCDQCRHIKDDDDGAHCYIFLHKADNCGQFNRSYP